MNIIFAALDEGRFMNVTAIHQALPYTCTYGALRTSLKFLKRHECLSMESVVHKNYYKPTAKGYALFRPVF